MVTQVEALRVTVVIPMAVLEEAMEVMAVMEAIPAGVQEAMEDTLVETVVTGTAVGTRAGGLTVLKAVEVRTEEEGGPALRMEATVATKATPAVGPTVRGALAIDEDDNEYGYLMKLTKRFSEFYKTYKPKLIL